MIPESGSIPSSKQKGSPRNCTKWKGQNKELFRKRKERIVSGKIIFPPGEGQGYLSSRLPH